MNEAETRAELIDPKIKACGWGVIEGSKVLREYQTTDGKIQSGGSRGRKKINNLEDLKKSILQKAFAGELIKQEIMV